MDSMYDISGTSMKHDLGNTWLHHSIITTFEQLFPDKVKSEWPRVFRCFCVSSRRNPLSMTSDAFRRWGLILVSVRGLTETSDKRSSIYEKTFGTVLYDSLFYMLRSFLLRNQIEGETYENS